MLVSAVGAEFTLATKIVTADDLLGVRNGQDFRVFEVTYHRGQEGGSDKYAHTICFLLMKQEESPSIPSSGTPGFSQWNSSSYGYLLTHCMTF